MDGGAREELDRLRAELARERELVYSAEELRLARARLERVQGRQPGGEIAAALERARENIRRLEARIAEIEGRLRDG